MVRAVRGLDPDRLAQNVAGVRAEIADAARRAGRDPDEVELVAAVKYVDAEELGVLAAAGLRVLGENRAQELERKAALAPPGAFAWDFIGALQSRKVAALVGRVRLIHSVASDSALAQLARHAPAGTEVLVEVNVAGEEGKGGIAPAALPAFLERCPVRVSGLMTMPPLAPRPEESRRHFAALRSLAAEHGLARLSMGTSQDYPIAVEEGATLVRVGSVLYTAGSAGPGG